MAQPREEQLSRALESLPKSPDGNPDYQLRRVNINNLVERLAVRELQELKEYLSSKHFQRDIIADLPVELVALVAEHLELSDLWASVAVSRAWRAQLSTDQVMFVIADRFFPSLAYRHAKLAGDNQMNSAIPQLAPAVLKACRSVLRSMKGVLPAEFIRNGYFWVNSSFKVDEGGPELSRFENAEYHTPLKVLYSHGRVCWDVQNNFLVVDSLASRSRKFFSVPGALLIGTGLQLQAIGDKLLVGSIDRRLFAWDLATGFCERVTLPSTPTSCVTGGSRIAIITSTRRTFIWQWSNRSSLVEVELEAESQWMAFAVEPALNNTIFFATMNSPRGVSEAVTEVTISEIQGARVINKFTYAIDGAPKDMSGRADSMVFHFKRANAYGEYEVCQFADNVRSISEVPVCSLLFDVYHRTFRKLEIESDLCDTAVRDDWSTQGMVFCWNGVFWVLNPEHPDLRLPYPARPHDPAGPNFSVRPRSIKRDYLGVMIVNGVIDSSLVPDRFLKEGSLSSVGDDDFLVLTSVSEYGFWQFTSP